MKEANEYANVARVIPRLQTPTGLLESPIHHRLAQPGLQFALWVEAFHGDRDSAWSKLRKP